MYNHIHQLSAEILPTPPPTTTTTTKQNVCPAVHIRVLAGKKKTEKFVHKAACAPAYGLFKSLQFWRATAGYFKLARLPGKVAGHGCRARLQGKAAGQGCRAIVQYADCMVNLDNYALLPFVIDVDDNRP
jgi:hypothetical protein